MAEPTIRKTVTVFVPVEELKEYDAARGKEHMTTFLRGLARLGWEHRQEMVPDEITRVHKDKGIWCHKNIFLPVDEAREHDKLRGKIPMTAFYLELIRIGWRHRNETKTP